MVRTHAGDRSDELVAESARAAACGFDYVIIREDEDLRGRNPGEVAAIISQTFREEKPELPVEIILDELSAFSTAIDRLQPGELVVAFCDRTSEVKRILEERRKATEGVRELARRAFESAEKKNSEFEHALHIARAELHQEHEALRRQWSEEQAQAIAQARAEADTRVQAARQPIAQEAARAEADLDARIETFSRQIEDAVLTRRAA